MTAVVPTFATLEHVLALNDPSAAHGGPQWPI
ncbi:hypothetical protein ATJ97_1354 [Georgenia soli]|uniref:Uncharacterized protein n=1 Tax=Georgenia soli TaxID=638953 RepID=A0A2A9EKT8_9MICO|nr:hypothetical protein ATJ97_1354 [Georgenia soli]